jgi:FkbM family methyltransferase
VSGVDVTRAYDLDFRFPASDTVVGATLRTFGEFSRVELDVLLHLAPQPSGVMIDAGANIGSLALPFAKARPGWRVMAYEAQRWISHLLAANAIANDLLNVEPIHAALGREESLTDFPMAALDASLNFGGLGFGSAGVSNERVRVTRLDDLPPSVHSLVRVVKMDLQGFEPEVLRGAGELLTRVRPAWIAEADRNQEAVARSTIRVFFEAGYTLHWLFVPFATRTAPRNGDKATLTGDFNIVALPEGMGLPDDIPRLEGPDAPFPTSLDGLPYLRRYGF